jgi:hypothetical protein
MSCFETKRKGLFCDFWHIHDDFAIKNATNIIFKAGKAPSYSSLHDLSNGAKRWEILCRKRDKKLTLQRHCPLSSSSSKKKIASLNFLNFEYVNFEYVTHACPAFTPQRVLLSHPTPTACKQEALPAKV